MRVTFSRRAAKSRGSCDISSYKKVKMYQNNNNEICLCGRGRALGPNRGGVSRAIPIVHTYY